MRPRCTAKKEVTGVDVNQCENTAAPLLVLIADEDKSVRRLAGAILQREGFRIIEATDGTELVEAARRLQPDIIVTSVLLSDIDGLEAIRRLRAGAETMEIPIIVLSARDDASDVIAGLDAGADDYAIKPFLPHDLVTRLRVMSRLSCAYHELKRSHDVLGEQTRALGLLLDLSTSLARSEELEQVLTHTVKVAGELSMCRDIHVLLAKRDGRHLRLTDSSPGGTHHASIGSWLIDGTICGSAFSTRAPVVVNRAADLAGRTDAADARLFEDRPAAAIPMNASDKTVGVLVVGGGRRHQPFTTQEVEYLKLIGNCAASSVQGILARQAREDARDSIVVALASLAEHRDDDTGRHLDRMTGFCLILAEELRRDSPYASQIDGSFVKSLRRAAPLHDIGKVAIPDHILLKPGKLSDAEMEVMRTHVAIGAETIRSVQLRSPETRFLAMAEEITAAHHEWFDGGGYPRGIRGVEIPFPARIAALADVYDALTSKRVYKDAVSHEEAKTVIMDLSGRQFDPVIVDAFVAVQQQFERLSKELGDRGPDETGAAFNVDSTFETRQPDPDAPSGVAPGGGSDHRLSPCRTGSGDR